MSYFGTIAAGQVAVPVNYRLSPPEVGYILSDCGARVTVTTAEQYRKIAGCGESGGVATWVLIDEEIPGKAVTFAHALDRPPCAAPAAADPDDVACLMYTSGTTGYPKGAMLSHRNKMFNVDSCRATLGYRERDIGLCVDPAVPCDRAAFPARGAARLRRHGRSPAGVRHAERPRTDLDAQGHRAVLRPGHLQTDIPSEGSGRLRPLLGPGGRVRRRPHGRGDHQRAPRDLSRRAAQRLRSDGMHLPGDRSPRPPGAQPRRFRGASGSGRRRGGARSVGRGASPRRIGRTLPSRAKHRERIFPGPGEDAGGVSRADGSGPATWPGSTGTGSSASSTA